MNNPIQTRFFGHKHRWVLCYLVLTSATLTGKYQCAVACSACPGTENSGVLLLPLEGGSENRRLTLHQLNYHWQAKHLVPPHTEGRIFRGMNWYLRAASYQTPLQ